MGDKETQTKEQVTIRFGEGIGLSHQPRKSASEGTVKSLDVVGCPSFFVRNVLVFRKNGGIGFP